MATWTEELKQEVIAKYEGAGPTPESSTEIIKDIAEEMESYKAYANALQTEENMRINSSIYEALRSSAEIEDNRQLYY